MDIIGRKAIRQVLKLWRATERMGEHELARLRIVQARCRKQKYQHTPAGRGLALRELLQEALQALQPEEGVPNLEDRRWWPYFILNEQYCHQRDLHWIAEQLHLARRTYHKHQAAALDAVAAQLGRWEEKARARGRGWGVSLGPPFLAPPRPVHSLVGRQQLLDRVKASLLGGADVGFYGLPGVGKTALAIELAHDLQVRHRFSDGILWASLGQRPDLHTPLLSWARSLGLNVGEAEGAASLDQLARRLHEVMSNGRFLLIVDDAWDSGAALNFRLGGPNCARIVTSRRAAVALDFAGERAQKIPQLEPDQGLALLQQMAPEPFAAAAEELHGLVRAAGGLPLALLLVGRHLRREVPQGRARPLQKVLKQLHSSGQRLTLALPVDALSRRPEAPPGTPLSLAAAIRLSYAALTAEAQKALRQLALFPPNPDSFSEEAALVVMATGPDSLDALVCEGLVGVGADKRYTVHKTIADFGRLEAEEEAAHRRLVMYYVNYIVRHAQDDMVLEQELSNIREALDTAVTRQMYSQLIEGVLSLFPFLLRRAQYAPAIHYLTEAIAFARLVGADGSLARLLTQRGTCIVAQGRAASAVLPFEEAKRLARQQGLSSLEAEVMVRLGAILPALGRPGDGERMLLEGLALAQQIEDGDREILALTGLAGYYNKRGEYLSAQTAIERGLTLVTRNQAFEREIPLRNLLGIALAEMGCLDEAQTQYETGLALARDLGAQRFEPLFLSNLGALYLEQQQFSRAQSLLHNALAQSRAYGERKTEAFALFALGETYRKLGDQATADEHFRQANALRRRLGYQPYSILSRE